MLVRFTNPDLCALTEQVIFSDPYAQAPLNRWTTPQLDEAAAGLRADTEAKAAISVLKRKFCSSADALIHGDLHTGSIMVRGGCLWRWCGVARAWCSMVWLRLVDCRRQTVLSAMVVL
jgi:S-methyl-5-thioribose kinase